MFSGRDNLKLINQHVYQTRTEQEETGRHLEELQRQLNALRLETSERYRELARFRLDNFQANQIITELNETDQVIINLLEKLKEARQNLEEQLKDSYNRQEQLEGQRKELERKRDEAGVQMQRQLEQTHNRLKEIEAYRQQQKRTQETATVAKHAGEKASQAEADRLRKGKPYEDDRLFMYLWNRRYLTPDYQGGWFTRQLDEWVARFIDFRRNRANYHMLQELPRRLREHAAKAQQAAQAEIEALRAIEKEALEADGIPAFQTKVHEAEKQLKQLDVEIEVEEARQQKLLQEQAALNNGTDPLSKQIIDLQTAELEKEQLYNLYKNARATPRPEDDVIVAKLQQLRQRQDETNALIQSENARLQQQQRNLAELEEVRRRYRQNGYDAYNSSFPGNFALSVLLGQMLGGMMNSDGVWREIGRNQQTGPSWGDSGEGWGGFGGDMGGGEFRTGGEF